MPEYTSLEKIRLQKIEELRAAGVEPYPTRAERTHTSAEAIAAFEAAEKEGRASSPQGEVKVTLAGRIRATRPMGKISCAHIEDGAGKVQLFFRMNELTQERVDFFNRLFDIGDFIQASGVMFRTKTGEITLHVHDFKLLAKAVSPLPAAKDETTVPAPGRGRFITGLGVTQIVSWGTLYYSFPLIAEPMSRELALAKPAVYGAATVGILVAGLASLPVGAAIDRGYGRAVMTLGSVLGGLLLIGWSQVASLWPFYFLFAGVGLAQAMTMYEPAFAVIARRYGAEARRGITAVTLWGEFASTVFI